LTAEQLTKNQPEAIELVDSLLSYERPLPTMEAYDQLLMHAPVGEVMQ
jgi:hypothetical protein